MTAALVRRALVAAVVLLLPRGARAQDPAGFFDTEAPIEIRLTANFNALRADRSEEPAWRWASIDYRDPAGTAVEVSIRIRPRGLWRRQNCELPPMRLDLPRRMLAGTPLAGLNRPKLVNFCENTVRGEQYILQELQLYRVYHALTPESHRARLLRVTYTDSGSRRVRAVRYAFLIEEPDAVASRLGARDLGLTSIASEDLEVRSRTVFALFQHLIGNHDWSLNGIHNVEILGRDSVMIPIAYDFDHAGAVDAYYARPPKHVPIQRVRERYFRGDCAPPEVLREVIAHFVARRDAIRALYADEIGRLMRPDVARRTLDYFEDFYEAVQDPAKVQRTIVRHCGPA